MSKTDLFQERRVVVETPSHHYTILEAKNGSFASFDGEALCLTNEGDDSIVWDTSDGQYIHVETGAIFEQEPEGFNGRVALRLKSEEVQLTDEVRETTFKPLHGPAELPSHYLKLLRSNGWVCLTSILDSDTVEGLEWVACTDRYEDREAPRTWALSQHVAVAKTVAEPVSLWLIRQYMGIPDIRLSHAPGMAVLRKDDGKRNVQGWHSDFPYHWGTGHKGQVPTPSGETILGVQRNVCVSEFKKERGATAFKLGSHAQDRGPPEEWGIASMHARPGYRAAHGLPYSGPNADIVEAPGGSIILYDSRTWHRAGVNRTEKRRAAMLQAMTPMYVFPKNDTSIAFRAFKESPVYSEASERERMEIEHLMVHQFIGPGGEYAIAPDRELTESLEHSQARTKGY